MSADFQDHKATPATDTKGRKLTAVCVAVGFTGLFALANLPYRYSVVGKEFYGDMQTPVDFPVDVSEPPAMGGFPATYLVKYEPSGDTRTTFFVTGLLYNILIFAVLGGLCFWYLRFRHTHAAKRKKRSLSVADLLLLMLLVALSFGVWRFALSRRKSEIDLAEKVVDAGGAAQLEARMPTLLIDHLPDSLTPFLVRVSTVRLESPTDERVAEVVSRRNLTTLRLGGGEYDLKLLEQLVSNRLLIDLRIGGRVLDTRTMQAIASIRQLRSLNLMRTNVDSQSVALLQGLQHLQRLNLIHTDVKLSELGLPGWANTIRELHVGHPNPGVSDQLTIDGWSSLQTLRINELDSQGNESTMKVELANLPNLQQVDLDVFQKFDLQFHNLPILESINELKHELSVRIPRGGMAPGLIWVTRIDFDKLPALKELNFFAGDLTHFKLANTPALESCDVGAFYRSQSTSHFMREFSDETIEALFSGLANSEGPQRINFERVPLTNADFSQLTRNRSIARLNLNFSRSSFKHWKQLEGMTWLRTLSIKGCPVTGEQTNWLLNAFPELEEFAVSEPTASSGPAGARFPLEIVDRPNLAVLDFGEMSTSRFDRVKVVNVPNLESFLDLVQPTALEIRGSPGIRGLTVAGPLPAEVNLADFRDLEYFEVGGQFVDDDVIRSIRECKKLMTLTLAYPSGTSASLKTLDNIGSVRTLLIPGAAVDDEVVSEWPDFEAMMNLDLRDTNITEKSIQQLLKSTMAEYLRIDRTNVSPENLEILGDQVNLKFLSASGVGISPECLQLVLANGSLHTLDLSDSTIDPGILDAILLNGSRLRVLALRNCQIDGTKLMQVAQRFPALSFDVTGSDLSSQVLAALVSRRQLIDADSAQQPTGPANSKIEIDSFQRSASSKRDPQAQQLGKLAVDRETLVSCDHQPP